MLCNFIPQTAQFRLTLKRIEVEPSPDFLDDVCPRIGLRVLIECSAPPNTQEVGTDVQSLHVSFGCH